MRQFIAEQEPDSTGCLTVTGRKFHYMKSVLRVECGDMICVRLTDGTLQNMTVAKIDTASKKIILKIAGENKQKSSAAKAEPVKEKPLTEIILFQFVAKPPKMDLIIRQAVECGVSKIIPVEGEFCQKGSIESARKKTDGHDERWQRIITEARQQSGSPVETKILPPASVEDACRIWQEENNNNCTGIVLYEQTEGTMSVHDALKNADVILKAAVAVGAEGGISSEEICTLRKNGFIPVHLETNILRCETASLYGIAALQTAMTYKTSDVFFNGE